MTDTGEQTIHTCAKCGAKTERQLAIDNEYKCSQCAYELAHLDVAANGAIRGVFGWLKETGALIGDRYQVETVLGKGGFGATYLVSDQRVKGKRWALKEIPEILFDEYEVSLLSQLDHPSIPIIVDRFSDGDMVYLVLKFGGTKTLAGVCKLQRQVDYSMLKPWIIQLADVLTYLHTRTPPIIHRDLKPENILLDNEDRVMLIDFGIAKESIAEIATRTLGRAASHGFSPPEQVMGTGTDVRSDIYSLAATVYYALVGKSPVAAHERVAGAVLQTPGELDVALPAEVEAMLLQALSLNINERPSTVQEFVEAFTGGVGTSSQEQNTKTVQISDIQFGPVVHDKTSRSKPLTQGIDALAGQDNQSLKNAMILGLILLTTLGGAGAAYWYFNDADDNKEMLVSKPADVATSAMVAPNTSVNNAVAISQPVVQIAPVRQSPDALQLDPFQSANHIPKQDANTPSALDVLMQKQAEQKSVDIKAKESVESQLKTDLAAEQARKAEALAKKERDRKAREKRARQREASRLATKRQVKKSTKSAKSSWSNTPQAPGQF